MSLYNSRLGRIQKATGAATLTIAHTGKDESRGLRGSYALFAAYDAILQIKSGDGAVNEVLAEKVRDNVRGPLFTYELEQVQLGTDDDGDDITTCVVKPVNVPIKPKSKRLGPQAQRAWEQLVNLYTNGQARRVTPCLLNLEGVTERDMPMVVTLDEWRLACRNARLTTSDKVDAERQAFNRALNSLEKYARVQRYGEYAWMLGQQHRHRDNAERDNS
jgi:hypothetical protein